MNQIANIAEALALELQKLQKGVKIRDELLDFKATKIDELTARNTKLQEQIKKLPRASNNAEGVASTATNNALLAAQAEVKSLQSRIVALSKDPSNWIHVKDVLDNDMTNLFTRVGSEKKALEQKVKEQMQEIEDLKRRLIASE